MTTNEQSKKTSAYIPVPGAMALWMIPGTDCVSERKHSAARHSTAPQGKARHRTAPHGASLRADEP